jgi:hypothetical protein
MQPDTIEREFRAVLGAPTHEDAKDGLIILEVFALGDGNALRAIMSLRDQGIMSTNEAYYFLDRFSLGAVIDANGEVVAEETPDEEEVKLQAALPRDPVEEAAYDVAQNAQRVEVWRRLRLTEPANLLESSPDEFHEKAEFGHHEYASRWDD